MKRSVSVFLAMVMTSIMTVLPAQAAAAATVPGAWHLTKTPDPELVDDPRGLFVVGDSLTFNAWAYAGMSERIARQGWLLSGYEIHSGMEVWEVLPRLEPVISDIPGTVVIALGINDLIMGGSIPQFRRQVRAIVQLLGDRRVIWVGPHDPIRLDFAERTRVYTRALIREMRRHPQARYADWAASVSRNPQWISEDDPWGVHLSVRGSQALTGFILRRLKELPTQDEVSGLVAERADGDQDDVDQGTDAQ